MTNHASNRVIHAPHHVLENGGLTCSFLYSGDVYEMKTRSTMINQLLSHSVDGSLNNLYLRIHDEKGIHAVPMLGIHSNARVSRVGNRMIWQGEAEGIFYKVVFTLTAQAIWFWEVELEGAGKTVDVIYGQDVGIASPGAVRSNEAYLSQYIDHTVFNDEQKGYVVCSRQNQPQAGEFPYLQQGSLTKAVGYSTDGFQFFGLSYKETNKPEALAQKTLANEVYQYEFAYTALKSELVALNGKASFVFYGLFQSNHASAVQELEFASEVAAAWKQVKQEPVVAGTEFVRATLSPQLGEPVRTESFTTEELNRLFPNRRQEEREGDTLLSFFTDTYEHVVLKEKELRVERPHGHILMSGSNERVNSDVISTTAYMYGVFNSHIVVGNTNFNKLMSNTRNALNVAKMSGQRIYVRMEGQYRLLTLPSVFEIGFNYARWYYKMADDVLVITNYSMADAPQLSLDFKSLQGREYSCLITNQMTMNVNEFEVPYHQRTESNAVIFTADASSLSHKFYPALKYKLQVLGTTMRVCDENKLLTPAPAYIAPLTVLELGASSQWTISIQGNVDGRLQEVKQPEATDEIEKYRLFLADLMNGFRLTEQSEEGSLFKMNALAWWYTHNMLVHYSMPHGLEQYGGAAWGTRDVCQGPVEYFMSMGKYEPVREIILAVFAHQYEDDGNWPQWFMFDKYSTIQQEESHGDIIVWPLKVLGDYLSITQDYGILEAKIPYTEKGSFEFTTHQATLLEHAMKEVDYIKGHFLHDTYLSSYGDGDWDDTLQPANAQLKKYMVSSWTVALTYQTIKRFAQAMSQVNAAASAELTQMYEGIQRDFNRYMLETEVVPGFLYLEDADKPKPMLHPTESETGIQYRLLPMTRSMIGELFTPEQAAAHYDLIHRELLCPDGVRLMNRPAQYAGGVSTHFKRAEQASNFGREIGLQYVHAHIRYVEASAKLGRRDQVWKALEVINPVGIREVVPNAELRQSNSYFSSSDGKFNNRYDAQEQFNKLRTGDIAVKGGWRIYSSGPGIYMNQLISNALGIRQEEGNLVIDPVLPESLNHMRFSFVVQGVKVEFVYHLTNRDSIERITMNGQELHFEYTDNRYRAGGACIQHDEFESLVQSGRNIIEIYM
ncbi:GH36-type glycosyl hydrolase domain-containing protein [Paenibacillus timonensis]|uniref:GH36-type glycosyl hydrolase domain-containing protein n=1 Tax=Paenibacillus timonensis TaxID=225915 RepID=UPI003F9684DE